MDFSLIIPIHNEEPILRKNVRLLYERLSANPLLGSFEIILACNGCTDASVEIAAELEKENPSIRHLALQERGLGNAIRVAAMAASYEPMMFYAIDLPFGLNVLDGSISAASRDGGSVIIGSKGHRGSVVQRSLARWLFSSTISVLNNLFFGLGVKDTQGSILFYKEPLRRFGAMMDNPGAFFQTQILIYSKLCGYRLTEIPVSLAKEMRRTRFKLISDGLGYIRSIIREKVKLAQKRVK